MSGAVLNHVRRNFYLDSVALMRLSRSIAVLPGVLEAALMMGTPANRQIMHEADLLTEVGAAAAANDLVVAVRAESRAAAETALAQAAVQLEKPRAVSPEGSETRVHSLRAAMREMPDATLALISVPGEFAAAVARKAIRSGLDVMIFSGDVSLADERNLKEEARSVGRLVMGADCGTAIINGVPLAFANRVPRGEIGIIGASGTGMQEASCLIAQAGAGISQAIGVGGRDFSREIGGITTLMAIDLLDTDPQTRRVVLISKPPHPAVAGAVLARVAASTKPFTICFLGATELTLPANAHPAATLRAAAEDALGGARIGPGFRIGPGRQQPRTGAIVGLYSGGTLCAEAQLILVQAGHTVASNAPVPGARTLSAEGERYDRLLDLGTDEFMRGRPHPMIDPSNRAGMLRATLADSSIAVVLVDVVIGFGAHDDPAGTIAAVVAEAPADHPIIVASVTGTEDDPQVRSRQAAILECAGVLVAPSNAHAAELALALRRT